MRILEVNTEKGWRGGERQTLYTLEALRGKGVEVDLLCLRDNPLHQRALSTLFTKSTKVNHRIEKTSCSDMEKEIPGRTSCNIHCVRSNFRAFLFLLRHGKHYDLIHCQTARAQTLAVITKPFHSKPIVYTRRVDFRPKGLATKLKYRLTDKVVAISEKIKMVLSEAGFKPLDEIEVISSAVKERDLNGQRAANLKQAINAVNKKIIATMGALVGHKDPFTMLEAIRILSQKRDDFIFLHFGDGRLKVEMEKRIKQYGLSDKYILVGFEEDAEDFFLIIDVFVMSSKEEGLGSTVLDAFLYRVPVVSTDAGGLREIVSSRGILCSVGDPASLARGIESILDNTELRRDLIDKAYADVIANYSIEKMGDQYLRVFSSLLKART
ncbi:MAG: glycosyltransferase family 4 protein [bacterium]